MTESNARRRFLITAAAAGTLGAAAARASGAMAKTSVYNVADFGASRSTPDRLATKSIQSAIDACAAAGGGTVYFPAGNYFSGGLILKSRVHLYLDAGAVLHGSARLEDFPKTIPKIRSYTDNYTERSLLYAEGLENIGIHGDGVIDGHGKAFEGPYKVRPYMIRIVSCTGVSVTGVTIRDSPMWVQHYLACDDVSIHGITVFSRVNHNNDGIDIDGCRRVTISDCNISSGDDAIVLKSTLDRRTSSVAITNCVLSSHCNAFKLGTESNGGFEDIVLNNCTMYDTRLSGIAVECVDGGLLDGVSVSNVTMRGVKNPLFIRLGRRNRPFEEGRPVASESVLRNVSISNVKAEGASAVGCAISGVPGHFIEGLVLENIHIISEGGVNDPPGDVPEEDTAYPEHKMFGTLPAHGFFCRHVRGLRFHGIFAGTAAPDARPALVCDDVWDIEIASSVWNASTSAIRFRNVNGGLIHGCRLHKSAAAFLDIAPGAVRDVYVTGNDLSRAIEPIRGDGVQLGPNRS